MKALILGKDVGVWLMFAWWDGAGGGSKEWLFIECDCLYSKSKIEQLYVVVSLFLSCYILNIVWISALDVQCKVESNNG